MARGRSSARPRGRDRIGGDDTDTTLDRIERVLDRWPAGMHDLGEPGAAVPLAWPASLQELYMTWDGLRLFGEAIELRPAREVTTEDGRWLIGVAWGDELAVDARGRVWRDEDSVWTCDGTSIERWLSGAIDAEAMLYDGDGEYADDVFDDDGELLPAIAAARAKAQLARDKRAPGPRLRMARLLRLEAAAAAQAGDAGAAAAARDEARDLLEGLVADEPAMAWAWLELARISEELGELDGALDEATAAAEAAAAAAGDRPDDDGADEAFFWAHAARLAAARGDEPRRAAAATRARAARAAIVEELVAGAGDNLGSGDPEAAAAMVTLARAIAPRVLAVLELSRRVEEARAKAAETETEAEVEAEVETEAEAD